MLIMDMPRSMEQLSKTQIDMLEYWTDTGRQLEGNKYGGASSCALRLTLAFAMATPARCP